MSWHFRTMDLDCGAGGSWEGWSRSSRKKRRTSRRVQTEEPVSLDLGHPVCAYCRLLRPEVLERVCDNNHYLHLGCVCSWISEGPSGHCGQCLQRRETWRADPATFSESVTLLRSVGRWEWQERYPITDRIGSPFWVPLKLLDWSNSVAPPHTQTNGIYDIYTLFLFLLFTVCLVETYARWIYY